MRIVEIISYGHVPPARDRRTSEGCPGVVLRATQGDRNNIPYNKPLIAFCNLDPVKYSNYIKLSKVLGTIECVKYLTD